MQFEFKLTPAIVFGPGARNRLPELPAVAGKRCMLLRFPGCDSAELEKRCGSLLIPDWFEENPSESLARRLGALAAERQVETIIAIGGGSTIDSAKAAAWFAANPEWKMTGENPAPRSCSVSVVAVPTTAGTGSEVTPYSILTGEDHFKRILTHPSLVPEQVVCDPELTLSLPPRVTAHTGIDALSHLIEAYLAESCTGLLEEIALAGLKRGIAALPEVLNAPDAIKPREEMMLAALNGGIVLAHCGTVMVHALGYCLTRQFSHRHGEANAILLPAFLNCLAGRGCARAKQIVELFGGDPAGFVRCCGIEPAFPAVDDRTLAEWVEAGYRSYGRSNCVAELQREEIEFILYHSMKGQSA